MVTGQNDNLTKGLLDEMLDKMPLNQIILDNMTIGPHGRGPIGNSPTKVSLSLIHAQNTKQCQQREKR